MARNAKIDQSVFELVWPELKKYGEQTADLERAVSATLQKLLYEADLAIAELRRDLERAVGEYEKCSTQSDANCSGFLSRVSHCEQALKDGKKGRAMIEAAQTRFGYAQRKHRTRVEQLLHEGKKLITTAEQRTADYQRSSGYTASSVLLSYQRSRSDFSGAGLITASVAGGTIESGEVADPPYESLPGVERPEYFPPGFVSVPLNSISTADAVTGIDAFDAGQSVNDLRWASDALFGVVIPAMRSVPDVRSYLRQRDSSEGRHGDRSYLATYDGFFGDQAVSLSHSAGAEKFDVINGRHRLWLLAQVGATHVPARMRSAR